LNIKSEINALQTWNGRGTVLLLDYYLEIGAMLLEMLSPGETLKTLSNDDDATRIIVQFYKKLWLPVA